MTVRPTAVLLVISALAAGGCGQKIQEEYKLQIIGPRDGKYLASATTVMLWAGDKEIASASISPNMGFTLVGGGLDPKLTRSAVFRIKALDASKNVVAQGQSPPIALELTSPDIPVRVFIQPPGTLAIAGELDVARRDLVALAAEAPPSTAGTTAPTITVGFFGLGTALIREAGGEVERPSDELFIYNPVIHSIDTAGRSPGSGTQSQARTGASAVFHPQGKQVLLFGGQVTAMGQPAQSGQVDVVQLQQSETQLFLFSPTARVLRPRPDLAVPRERAPMAEADVAYAFGGRVGDQVLDTVVAIDPNNVSDPFKLVAQKMAGPRLGHTATTVQITSPTMSAREILVFGGAADGVAVAELLTSSQPEGTKLVAPMGVPGPARRDHGAVTLPPNHDRVLVIGGRSNEGTALGTSFLYEGLEKKIGLGGITLKRPRHSFAAFVVGDDLVVAGGVDDQGTMINDAEVFSASRLTPKAVTPAHPRSGAAVIVLPNQMVLLLGGTEQGNKPSRMIEIYQPNIPEGQNPSSSRRRE